MKIEPDPRIPDGFSAFFDQASPLPCTTNPADFTNDFYRFGNSFRSRCSIPTMDGEPCGDPSIRAHSIPNRLTLDRITVDNHVTAVMIRRRRFDQPPLLEFKSVGRREASTFGGICGRHDNRIFLPIDRRDPDMASAKHQFLLSYRSVLREYFEKMRVIHAFQNAYQKHVEAGTCMSTRSNGCIHGWLMIHEVARAQFIFQHKNVLDNALRTRDWSVLAHRHFTLRDQAGTVAVSATADFGNVGSPTFTLNVFPTEAATVVLFSAVTQHIGQVSAHLDRILSARAWLRKYLLSKFILQSCDNFVIHPDYYAGMSDVKKKAMLQFYGHTVIENDESYEDENLYLF